MLTHSSVWIFNQMRYNGLYKRIYDLYLLGVAYFTLGPLVSLSK